MASATPVAVRIRPRGGHRRAAGRRAHRGSREVAGARPASAWPGSAVRLALLTHAGGSRYEPPLEPMLTPQLDPSAAAPAALVRQRYSRAGMVVASMLAATLALVFRLGVPFRGAFGARVTGDEPFYLLTTESLIQDGTWTWSTSTRPRPTASSSAIASRCGPSPSRRDGGGCRRTTLASVAGARPPTSWDGVMASSAF